MEEIKIYYNPLSQPSRTVLLLLEANKIKYEPCLVDVVKGETKTKEEFVRVSSTRAIPAMDDNGFHLCECAAIMKYLVTKYKLPDHWYPNDLKQRARIDEYLFWHISRLQPPKYNYFYCKYAGLVLEVDGTKDVDEVRKALQSWLNLIEEHFLKETRFIGGPEISIADLLAACQLTQFWVTDEDLLAGRPRVSQWLSDVKSGLPPHFDEVHKMVYHHKEQGTFTIKK